MYIIIPAFVSHMPKRVGYPPIQKNEIVLQGELK